MRKKFTTLFCTTLRTLCAALMLCTLTLSANAEVIELDPATIKTRLTVNEGEVAVLTLTQTTNFTFPRTFTNNGTLIIDCRNFNKRMNLSGDITNDGTIMFLGNVQMSGTAPLTNNGKIYAFNKIETSGDIFAGDGDYIKAQVYGDLKKDGKDVIYGEFKPYSLGYWDNINEYDDFAVKKFDGKSPSSTESGYKDYYAFGVKVSEQSIYPLYYFETFDTPAFNGYIEDLDEWKAGKGKVSGSIDDIKALALTTLTALLDGTGIDATDYEEAIAAATTEAEVNAVLAEAQAAADLANAKIDAIAALNDLVDGTDIDISDYIAAINAATTADDVATIKADTQALITLKKAQAAAIAEITAEAGTEYASLMETLIAAINAATTTDEVATAKAEALAMIALKKAQDAAIAEITAEAGTEYASLIETHIAAINAATTTGEVAAAKITALAALSLKKAQDAAIAELQAYANTNKIANVPIEKYAALINAETDVTAITDIVNDAKTEIGSYDRLTLGDWMYLMDEGKVLGNELALTDKDNYQSDYEVDIDELTYSRTFSSANWQALYVPFSMTYDDWKDDMDVYDIYNVLAYDEDNDGVIERTTVNMIRLKEGAVTEPNYPYVVRAKNTGAVEITLTDATLYPAEENTIDCTSTKQKFTFTGTYHKMTGLYTKGCYALDGGILKTATDDAVTLNPQRWYMEVTNRNGSPAAATRIFLNPFGEEDEVEGVKGVAVNIIGEETTYDLNGRTVNTIGLPKGLYVRGGKKIIVK